MISELECRNKKEYDGVSMAAINAYLRENGLYD